MQAEPVAIWPQDAACAASMSALLAVAQPVSSAEELLQRLQYGRIAVTASNGDEQHSDNSLVPALTSYKANHTGVSPGIETALAATSFTCHGRSVNLYYSHRIASAKHACVAA